MKKTALVILSLCALTACKNNSAMLGQDQNTIEYQVQGNEYAVVIIQSEGMSESEAKKMALQKAAALAQKNNYRYFAVEKEENVQAMSTSNSPYDNPPAPSNMYYELIQSDNFGRDRFENQQISPTGVYPAYRITIKCYQEKPSEKAIDSCTLVDCKK